MKVIRFTLIGLIVVVSLFALASLVALNSSFQTWAAKRILAKRADFTGQVGRMDAGLNHLRVEQLSVKRAGASLVSPAIDLDLSLWTAAQSDWQVKRLVAKGWTLDLTQATSLTSAPLGSTPASERASTVKNAVTTDLAPTVVNSFRGVLSQLKLPVDLAVDELELEGDVIIQSPAGQAPVRLNLVITGGQLGVGREGKFNFTVSASLTPAASVDALSAQGTLTVGMDTPRTFSRLGAEFQAEARGLQFPNGAKLGFLVSASRANAGESYTVIADSLGRKLITLQAGFTNISGGPSNQPLAGDWMLDVASSDLTPFTLGQPLPEFQARGSGAFTANAAFTAFSAKGKLAGNVAKLDVLRKELAGLNSIEFNADFDLVESDSVFRVASFNTEVSSPHPALLVHALQSFEYNAATGELKVPEPAKDLVSLKLQGVPLAWVQPWVHGIEISGGDVHGDFVVGTKNGAFTLRSIALLTVANFSASQSSQAWVKAIDLSMNVAADYALHGWQVEIDGAQARAGATQFADFSLKAGQLPGSDQPMKITGKWQASLGELTKQPFAARYSALTGGKISGDVIASLAAKKEYEARINFEGLMVDPAISALRLPDVRAEFRADIDEAGKITLNAPVLLERAGRKSDMKLAGTLAPSAGGWDVNAQVTSDFLATEDAQVLAAPFSGSDPKFSETKLPAVRDVQPRWLGLSGKVSLSFKKVLYQQTFEVSNVAASLAIEAGSLKLEWLRAGLGEGSDVKLGGAVTFDSAAKNPYTLKADFALINFDAAPFFHALDPGQPATVEGRFNATSRLAGSGLNLRQLVERTRGELQLTSRGGISRLLSADVSDKVKQSGSTVAAIGGLIGAMTGQEKISDFANKGQIVTEIANALKEIPYDQLNVAVTRGEDLNFNLLDFTLISPEVRLTGTGEIHYGEGVPVLAQPLDLKLQLGTRGKLADLMTRASLVDGTQDNLGYAGFSSFLRIAGSLEKPDTSEIRNVLVKAAGGSLLKIW